MKLDSTEILRFAKAVVKDRSRKGLNYFQVYDVDENVTGEWDYLYDLVGEMNEEAGMSRDQIEKMLHILAEWGKRSFFRIPMMTKGGRTLVAGVVVGRGNEMVCDGGYREWGIAVKVYQVNNWDLVGVAEENPKLYNELRWYLLMITLNLMGKILTRPIEYRLARGIRTNYERFHNMPAVVTISLSQPSVQVISDKHIVGGGWRNPEHLVRGHERHYKSGKVVWVEGHKRGDPHVQRRTTYRVIP